MATFRPIPEHEGLYEEDCDHYEHVNGASCLVIVDTWEVGVNEAAARAQDGRAAPTDEALGELIEAEIRHKIDACNANDQAKVQLMYHSDPKALMSRPGESRTWRIQNSIKYALRKFQSTPEPRLQKLILDGCNSQQYDLDLVREAFEISSIRYVLAFWEIVYLAPGRVSGANLGYQPRPLHIYVWRKEPDGKLIAKKPQQPIEHDQELDLGTMYVESKADSNDRCPTVHTLSGSGTESVGRYASRAAAQSAIINLSGPVPPFAYTFGERDAQELANDFECPNPGCQMTSLSQVTITNMTWSIRTSIIKSLLAIFGYRRWTLFVDYEWSARVSCY